MNSTQTIEWKAINIKTREVKIFTSRGRRDAFVNRKNAEYGGYLWNNY